MHTQTIIPDTTSKPTPLNTNAMDLTCSKLAAKEKKCHHTESICFYYGQAGNQIFSCPIKLTNRYIKAIQNVQNTPAAQPTSITQDLGKK